MTYYVRVGASTVILEEFKKLSKEEISNMQEDAIRAEKIRKENIAKSLGMENKINTTFDVRPEALNLVREEESKKNETQNIEEPLEPIKKSKKKDS
jgi:hypothetical protein